MYEFLVVSSRNGLWGKLLHREFIGVTLGSNAYKEMSHYKPVPREKPKPSAFSDSLKRNHGWGVVHRHSTHQILLESWPWGRDILGKVTFVPLGWQQLQKVTLPWATSSLLSWEQEAEHQIGFLNMNLQCHFKKPKLQCSEQWEA